MPRTIFISYRRADTQVWGRLIAGDLKKRIGDVDIVLDVSAMKPGQNFVDAIHRSVSDADIVLALIGQSWLEELNAPARLASRDYMRLELEIALGKGIRVIPLLIDRAVMPDETHLPASLQLLSNLHAISVTNTDFERDIEYLGDVIEEYFEELAAGEPRLAGAENVGKPQNTGFTMRLVEKAPERDEKLDKLPPVVPLSQIAQPRQPANILDARIRDLGPQPAPPFPETQQALRLKTPRKPDGSPRDIPKSGDPVKQSLIDGLAHYLDAGTPETATMVVESRERIWASLRREKGLVVVEPFVMWLPPNGTEVIRKVLIEEWSGRGVGSGENIQAVYFPDEDLDAIASIIMAVFDRIYGAPLAALPKMTINNLKASVGAGAEEKAPKTLPPVVPATTTPAQSATDPIAQAIRKAFTQLAAPDTPNATLLQFEDKTTKRSALFTRAGEIAALTVHAEALGAEQQAKAEAFLGKEWIKHNVRIWTPDKVYLVDFPLGDIDKLVSVSLAVFEHVLGAPLKRPPRVRFGSLDFNKYPQR